MRVRFRGQRARGAPEALLRVVDAGGVVHGRDRDVHVEVAVDHRAGGRIAYEGLAMHDRDRFVVCEPDLFEQFADVRMDLLVGQVLALGGAPRVDEMHGRVLHAAVGGAGRVDLHAGRGVGLAVPNQDG